MKPPTRIRIGPDEYAQLAVLDQDADAMRLRVSVVYEILIHCGDRGAVGNETLRTAARPLLELLRNNPELVAYLLAED